MSNETISVNCLLLEQAIEKYGKDKLKIYYSLGQSMYFSVTERKEKTAIKLVCLLPDEKVNLASLHVSVLLLVFFLGYWAAHVGQRL